MAGEQLNGPYPLQSGVSTSVHPDPGLELGLGRKGYLLCTLCSPLLGPCFLHKPPREYILVSVAAKHKGLWWNMQDTVDVSSAVGDFWLVLLISVERMQAAMRRNRIPVKALEWTFHEQPSWI